MNKSNCIKEAYLLTVRLFCFLMGIMMVSSCSKDATADDDAGADSDLRTVTFSVLQVENKPLASTRAVADLCNRLSLALFDYGSGEKVIQIDQTNIDEDFGFFEVKLPKGSYRMVVIGYTSDEAATISSYQNVSFYKNSIIDVYSYYYAFTLAEYDASIKAELKRVTSKIRLQITGEIPDDAYKIIMRYASPARDFNPYTGLGITPKSFSLQRIRTNGGLEIINANFFAMDNPQKLDTLVITAYTNTDKIIRQVKFVKSIDIAPNMLTLIKGDFFKNTLKTAVAVDDSWGATNEYDIPDETE
ncbi:MAG: FimB/Mfa2 family fimbrial subunit [Prevotella sp.]